MAGGITALSPKTSVPESPDPVDMFPYTAKKEFADGIKDLEMEKLSWIVQLAPIQS